MISSAGFGFEVLNCSGFEVPVGGYEDIVVSFRPDFTMRVITEIIVFTTQQVVELLVYVLVFHNFTDIVQRLTDLRKYYLTQLKFGLVIQFYLFA